MIHLTSRVIQEWLISIEGDSPWITASFPPMIVIGLPSSPETTLNIWSVYVPSAKKIVSPAVATSSAPDRLYNPLPDDDELGSGTTLYVAAWAWWIWEPIIDAADINHVDDAVVFLILSGVCLSRWRPWRREGSDQSRSNCGCKEGQYKGDCCQSDQRCPNHSCRDPGHCCIKQQQLLLLSILPK